MQARLYTLWFLGIALAAPMAAQVPGTTPAENAGTAPAAISASGQTRDQAFYRDYTLLDREKQEEEARDKARAERKGTAFSAEDKRPERILSMEFSRLPRPHSPEEFQRIWHFPPKRQWWTGNCWAFSSTSFMESEIHRMTGRSIKLSEVYTVYWEFVAKAREFVRTKGKSLVAEGSESNALLLRWKEVGIVPEQDYPGLLKGQTFFDQGPLVEELSAYMEFVKKNQIWDDAQVTASVRLILDKYLGTPPARITVDGKEMTPQEYLRDVLRINPDDYVEFMSFLYVPFWTRGEYKVADNYWHSTDYLNVPLDQWYEALKGAVSRGFSVCIGGDVSEPGYNGTEDVAIVPTFDCPPEYIDQSAREYRFENGSTGDDHGIHVVGLTRQGDHDWYLVKDSSRSGQRGVPGYYFYRDDYMRLKMLTFMVHKDAVRELLGHFEAENARRAAQDTQKH